MADKLAIYGATVGTLAMVGTVMQAAVATYAGLRDRARLRISLRPISGYFSLPSKVPTTVPIDNWYVGVEIANGGRRPVKVTSARLCLRDGRTIALLKDVAGRAVFPAVLDERNPEVCAALSMEGVRRGIQTGRIVEPTHIIVSTAQGETRQRISRTWRRWFHEIKSKAPTGGI